MTMAKRAIWGRRFRAARRWSNRVLRELAPIFEGDVLNVSGWRDEDKEGGRYQDYFLNAKSYRVTNFGGYRGEISRHEIQLDLESNLPPRLVGIADVVFNHTTLEHIFDVFRATSNLCLLSRDVVIVVVPAIQEEHPSESFGDFWRFMSGSLHRLFEMNGLTVLHLSSSPFNNCAVYHFVVASRFPDRWVNKISTLQGAVNTGKSFFSENLLERLALGLIRLKKKK
jgi:hypothetical protein